MNNSNDAEDSPLLRDKVNSSIEEEETSNLENEDTEGDSDVSTRNMIVGFLLSLLAATIFVINGIIIQYFTLNSVDTVAVRSFLQICFLGIFLKIKG